MHGNGSTTEGLAMVQSFGSLFLWPALQSHLLFPVTGKRLCCEMKASSPQSPSCCRRYPSFVAHIPAFTYVTHLL
jgi:hypothetical protein